MSMLNPDDYTNYIDSSDMIIEYYKNRSSSGLEKYFLEIENWLSKPAEQNNNKPLVIVAEEGFGKKTLVIKWMEYHQANSKKSVKDLIIPNFAGTGGNNSNYYYSIYRILIKLRETFDINQKVELLEEKLRKYFYYWLDVCSRMIENQVVNDQNVVLIFESINHYIDFETHLEASVGTWLPKSFPEKVKVIATVDPHSDAIGYFRELGCDMIYIESEPLIAQRQIDGHLSRPSFIINEPYKKQILDILNKKIQGLKHSLFLTTYLTTLLPYPSANIIEEKDINKSDFSMIYDEFEFNKLEKVNTLSELNDFILNYYEDNIIESQKFRTVMALLTLTQKGLTTAEIFAAADITIEDWNKIVAVFKNFLMKYQGLWKINNETFKKSVTTSCSLNQDYQRRLHLETAEVLNKTPNSIRKLEEQTYHLYYGGAYFKLKEAVSQIENFLLLFNPNNKYELYRYWQRLEKEGFDPATEYNKAVESFDMHYKPAPQDTFRIILQISRFLKEFSDFETDFTPEFRHPPIRGGDELYDIGLLQEIVKMDMYMPEEWALGKLQKVAPLGNDKEGGKGKQQVKNRRNKDTLNDKERKEKREEELKNLLKAVKEKMDRNKSLMNPSTSENGAGHEATHKKAMTLLGSPPVLPKDPHTALTNIQRGPDEENKKAFNRRPDIGKQQLLPQIPSNTTDRRVKPKYLKSNKKGAFDFYFETLNVEIGENRELLRMMYMLMGGMIDEATINPDASKNGAHFALEDDTKLRLEEHPEGTELEPHTRARAGLEAQREKLEEIMKRFYKQIEEKNNQTTDIVTTSKSPPPQEREPLYYYYKRWLWIMFPWVCLSTGNFFSERMEDCYSSATKYMSVKDERQFTQDALKIAIEAKLKKKAAYSKGAASELATSNLHAVGRSHNRLLNDSMQRTKANPQEIKGSHARKFSQTTLKEEISPNSSLIHRPNIANNIMLDNISPIGKGPKPFLSTKSKADTGQFFITNEFLNLGYLNTREQGLGSNEAVKRALNRSSTN